MHKRSNIWVTGHTGMVGGALLDLLQSEGYQNLLFESSAKLNLMDWHKTDAFFAENKPEYVFLSAARVGGIHANNAFPVQFIHDNLAITTNVISLAHKHGVKRLLFYGSSCAYPKNAAQPMRETELLASPLEATNKPYAIAKIAGLVLCESYNRQYGTDFRCIMPTNLYGERDNFHPENSHVLAALIYKFHQAKHQNSPAVRLWGSGTPRREFLHTKDLARAALFIMCQDADKIHSADRTNEHINVGCGEDITIKDLALLIKETVDYQGEIEWDASMPDGTPRKLLDISRISRLGWQHKVNLREGLHKTYEWFLKNEHKLRKI